MPRRTKWLLSAALAALTSSPLVAQPQQTTAPQAVPPVAPLGSSEVPVPTGHQRHTFTIDPLTTPGKLMPTPPKARPMAGPLTSDDLAKVPEVEFELATTGVPPADGVKSAAHQLAKINHLNAKKTDAFIAALLESRGDLAGLPFVMGDDCRTSPERGQHFQAAVNNVRAAMGGSGVGQFGGGRAGGFGGTSGFGPPGGFSGGMPVPPNGPPMQAPALFTSHARFWTQFAATCTAEDAARPATDKAGCEHATVARVAALMQMLAPETAEMRAGLVKYLASVSHVEATKALAKLAIFTAEDEIRTAATDALKVRRESDYTAVLVAGLRYPFPAVAKRAAEVIVKTGRKDLVPELVKVLDEADPRLPRDRGGKQVVREMVRVNHHRNCMMCHAPGTSAGISPTVFTAEVPIQGQPLLPPSQGYSRATPHPDLLVRIDVTYLRQDFSAMLPVTDAAPWPELQRFDFIVRERALNTQELATFNTTLAVKDDGVVTPYHRAALAALRDLTGKDAAPTAEAWRKLLKL
jgi:hypothetical protein